MPYPYQIRSLEEYQLRYKQSVENPRKVFGQMLPKIFCGERKMGQSAWNGNFYRT